jgi:hypothetical protein
MHIGSWCRILITEARGRQSPSAGIAPPPTQNFVLVQPIGQMQGGLHPPSYNNTTFGAPAVTGPGDPRANYNYSNQPGYPTGSGRLLPPGTGDQNPTAPSYGQKP